MCFVVNEFNKPFWNQNEKFQNAHDQRVVSQVKSNFWRVVVKSHIKHHSGRKIPSKSLSSTSQNQNWQSSTDKKIRTKIPKQRNIYRWTNDYYQCGDCHFFFNRGISYAYLNTKYTMKLIRNNGFIIFLRITLLTGCLELRCNIARKLFCRFIFTCLCTYVPRYILRL